MSQLPSLPRVQGLFHYYPESDSVRLMIAGREYSARTGKDLWALLESIARDGLKPLSQTAPRPKCAYCNPRS